MMVVSTFVILCTDALIRPHMRAKKKPEAHMSMNIHLSSSVSPEDDWLDFKGAMEYLRTSRSTIYRLMWSGQLKGKKVGLGLGTWRFSRAALRACMRDHEAKIPASSMRFAS